MCSMYFYDSKKWIKSRIKFWTREMSFDFSSYDIIYVCDFDHDFTTAMQLYNSIYNIEPFSLSQ